MPGVPPSRLLQVLNEAEGPGGLGDFEFTPYRLSMWASVRWTVVIRLGLTMSDMDWGARLNADHSSVLDKVAYVLRTARHSPRPPAGHFPILIFCSGVG